MSKPYFKHYDREEFERQLNARVLVPDCENIVAGNEARSAAYREAAQCHLDLAFGPSDLESLDLFVPQVTDAPVHLFVHGGYWRSRYKESFSFLARPLVDAGALVAITNYALCPTVTIDEIVRQVRSACVWLWRNAAEYGGDPQRLHVSGHSAGGHVAAMLAATDWPAMENDLPSDLIKSATPISGLFDLEPLLLHSVNDDLRLDREAARRNSPVHLPPPPHAPVSSVLVGGGESEEFRAQSRDFAVRWRETCPGVECVEIPGLNHFTILSGMDGADSPVTCTLLNRMGLG